MNKFARRLIERFSIVLLILAMGCSGGARSDGATGSGGTTGSGGATGGSGGVPGKGGKPGGGGAGAGGAAGRSAGGSNGGVSGTAGSGCPMQPVKKGGCRSLADCDPNPNVQREYYCIVNPTTNNSMCGSPCPTPPMQACTVDTDCPMNDFCFTGPRLCFCDQLPTTCNLSCKAPGVGPCAAGRICSPGTKGADGFGCVPVLCNAGYTCPTGYSCQVGAAAADGHGCVALPCSQTGCPANFVCETTATIGGCTAKRCFSDCDCDSAFCVEGSCSGVIGTCVRAAI